jgi:hypothetical protein
MAAARLCPLPLPLPSSIVLVLVLVTSSLAAVPVPAGSSWIHPGGVWIRALGDWICSLWPLCMRRRRFLCGYGVEVRRGTRGMAWPRCTGSRPDGLPAGAAFMWPSRAALILCSGGAPAAGSAHEGPVWCPCGRTCLSWSRRAGALVVRVCRRGWRWWLRPARDSPATAAVGALRRWWQGT